MICETVSVVHEECLPDMWKILGSILSIMKARQEEPQLPVPVSI